MHIDTIGKRINAHLKRFEADATINVPREGQTTRPYFMAGAAAAGRWVSVCYVSYQGNSSLTKADALTYLNWLDAGNIGRHYAALRAASKGA